MKEFLQIRQLVKPKLLGNITWTNELQKIVVFISPSLYLQYIYNIHIQIVLTTQLEFIFCHLCLKGTFPLF